MSKRMIAVSLAWGLMLLLTYTNMLRPFNNVLDVFCWLAYLFLLAGIVLWPNTGKDTRAEYAPRRTGWNDRISFESETQA